MHELYITLESESIDELENALDTIASSSMNLSNYYIQTDFECPNCTFESIIGNCDADGWYFECLACFSKYEYYKGKLHPRGD